MHPALAAHGALARGTFAVAVLVSLAVLFAPQSEVPAAPPGVDKVVHVLLFAALAVSGRWAGIGRRALTLMLVLYAAVGEVVQELTPLARSASVADLLADLVGVLFGLGLWALLTRPRR
jgi:VanZ family protein